GEARELLCAAPGCESTGRALPTGHHGAQPAVSLRRGVHRRRLLPAIERADRGARRAAALASTSGRARPALARFVHPRAGRTSAWRGSDRGETGDAARRLSHRMPIRDEDRRKWAPRPDATSLRAARWRPDRRARG